MRNSLFALLFFCIFLHSCDGKIDKIEQKKINRINKILDFFENTQISLGHEKDMRKVGIIVNPYLITYHDATFISKKALEDSLACNCKPHTKFKYEKSRYERYLKYTKDKILSSNRKSYYSLYICEVSENIFGSVLPYRDCHDPEIGWQGCKEYRYHPKYYVSVFFCFDDNNNIKYHFLQKQEIMP